MAERAPPGEPTIRLDIHTHLIPVAGGRLAECEGVTWDSAAPGLTIDGRRIGMASLFRPCDLVGWLDENRIEQAWISVPPPLYRQHLAAGPARDWTERLNRGLCALAEASRARFEPLLHLPVEHPELAAEIASEWMGRGLCRFAMASGCPGRTLSQGSYRPLWAALDQGRAFVLLHPGDCPDPRLEAFYLGNLLGNPYETALAAAHLVLSGVPAGYPDLTICLAHAGGLTALNEARLTRGFETRRPGLDPDLEPPGPALRRLYADSILHRREALALAATVFGPGHILFGSDWPFPMGLPDPHRQLDDMDIALRDAIFAAHPDARNADAPSRLAAAPLPQRHASTTRPQPPTRTSR